MGLGSRLSLEAPNKGIYLSGYVMSVGRMLCGTTVITDIVVLGVPSFFDMMLCWGLLDPSFSKKCFSFVCKGVLLPIYP